MVQDSQPSQLLLRLRCIVFEKCFEDVAWVVDEVGQGRVVGLIMVMGLILVLVLVVVLAGLAWACCRVRGLVGSSGRRVGAVERVARKGSAYDDSLVDDDAVEAGLVGVDERQDVERTIVVCHAERCIVSEFDAGR